MPGTSSTSNSPKKPAGGCPRYATPSSPCGFCRPTLPQPEPETSQSTVSFKESSGRSLQCKKKPAMKKCNNDSCSYFQSPSCMITQKKKSIPSSLRSSCSDSQSDSRSSCSRETCQSLKSNSLSEPRQTCKSTCSTHSSPASIRKTDTRVRCKRLETEGGVFAIRPCPYDSEGGTLEKCTDSDSDMTACVRRTTSMTKLEDHGGSPCMLEYQNERQRDLLDGSYRNRIGQKKSTDGPICPVALYGGRQVNNSIPAPGKGGRQRSSRKRAGRANPKTGKIEKKKNKTKAIEESGGSRGCWKAPKKPLWLRHPLTRRERKMVKKQLNYLACRHRVFFYTMRRRPCVCLYYLFPSIYPCFVQFVFFFETLWRCLLLTIAIIIWTPFFLLLMILQWLFCTLFCCECCP